MPVYKLLGVDLDKDLTFKHRLNVVLAMGQSAFEQFFHTAESAGFSVAVEALEVPRRLEPLVLYGSELPVLAEGAEMRPNRLQSSWAKTILGARSFTEVRGTLAVAECGWSLRLGTAMLEKAVLFFNKLLSCSSCQRATQQR